MIAAVVAHAEERTGFSNQLAIVVDGRGCNRQRALAIGGYVHVVRGAVGDAKFDGAVVRTGRDGRVDQSGQRHRAEFDFIVVDSAPVLPVADSLLIGQSVDGVIFSILREVSRLPKVYAAHQRLEMLGVRLLGAVVSGARVEDYGPDYEYVNEAMR